MSEAIAPAIVALTKAIVPGTNCTPVHVTQAAEIIARACFFLFFSSLAKKTAFPVLKISAITSLLSMKHSYKSKEGMVTWRQKANLPT